MGTDNYKVISEEQWNSLSNREVADLLGGVDPRTVAAWRRRNGKPTPARSRASRSGFDWDEVDWSFSDAFLAVSLRMPREVVRHQRAVRGEGPNPGPHSASPIPYDDLPLGQISDRSLAASLGIATNAVLAARKRRGIPAFVPNKKGQ
jgi:hypothetical protein